MYKNLLFGYAGGWTGLLRTGFWCAFFLVLFGLFLPEIPEKMPLQEATRHSSLTPMVTIPEDPRALRNDIVTDARKFNIAWLMESTGVVLPKGKNFVTATEAEERFIPDLVMRQLQARHNISNTDVLLYGRLGYRPVDLMVFTLQALHRKPDFIVVPINYAWSFSPYQISNRKLALDLAPKVWAHDPLHWWLIPLLSTPSQNLWALASVVFPVIADVTKNKAYLEYLFGGFFSSLSAATAAATPDITMRQPKTQVDFWLVNAMMQGNRKLLEDDGGSLSTEKRYAEIIRHGSPGSPSSFSTYSILEILVAAKQSGIPALFYLPPVSDDYYADAGVRQHMAAIESYMGSLRAHYKGTNVHILPATPASVRATIGFQKSDGFHQYDEGTYDAYLAEEVWKIIKDDKKLRGSGK